jgi:hypothetical protein
LIPKYMLSEMWIGLATCVLVETAPRDRRNVTVAAYMFVISQMGSVMSLMVTPLEVPNLHTHARTPTHTTVPHSYRPMHSCRRRHHRHNRYHRHYHRHHHRHHHRCRHPSLTNSIHTTTTATPSLPLPSCLSPHLTSCTFPQVLTGDLTSALLLICTGQTAATTITTTTTTTTTIAFRLLYSLITALRGDAVATPRGYNELSTITLMTLNYHLTTRQ